MRRSVKSTLAVSLAAAGLFGATVAASADNLAKACSNCGATEVIKLSTQTGGLNGAGFSLTNSDGKQVARVMTRNRNGADGIACVQGLPLGTYTWTEVKAPKGYAISGPASQTVSVSQPGDCTLIATVVTFFDSPL
jgi:uncharacterized surface anchored protein